MMTFRYPPLGESWRVLSAVE